MRIKQINFNWYATPDGVSFDNYQVGECANCKNIEEHPAMGEGDKWFFDVTLNDDSMVRIFNPNQVFYFKD